jgi:hypothetical protein
MAISAQFTADFSAWKKSCEDARGDIEKVRETTDKFASVAVQKQAEEFGSRLRTLGGDAIRMGADFVKAYAEEEQATASLNAALDAQGLAGKGVEEAYAAMAAQMQTTTRFADDAVTRSQTIFTTIGKLGPEQMQPALDAAANLAIAMKTDLPTAAAMMAKAFGSGGESLGKLKALLGESADDAKDFDSIVAALNKQFGGQAAADINTTAGSIERFKNQMGDAEEQVGGFLKSAGQPLADLFVSLPSSMQNTITTVAALGGPIGGLILQVGGVVSSFVPLITLLGGTGALTAALSAAGAALVTFALPIAAVIAAVAAVYLAFKNWDKITEFVAGVYNAIKTYLVDKFTALVSSIMGPINAVVGGFKTMWDKVAGHSYVPDMVNTIADQFGRLPDVMTKPSVDAANDTTAAMAAAKTAMDDAARAWVDSPFNRMSKNYMTVLTDSGGVAHDMAGRPVAVGGELGGVARSMGQQNISVTINGSVLSTKEQLSMAMGDAMMQAYRQGGGRVPI